MGKTAFLFPGQGSQYTGMGKSLCEISSAANAVFEEANDALGFDIKKLCFEGSMEELTKTENTQPAILTVSVAAYRVYTAEIGAPADFSAGHSLGEYSALCCSGALAFADAVRLVRQRGRFMQEAVAPGVGTMAAVSGVGRARIEEVCAGISRPEALVVVSNYNSPDQIVLSGHASAVAKAGETLAAQGARVIPLKVSAPFHSPLMQPAADRLKEALSELTFGGFSYPVLSNVTAQPYDGAQSVPGLLTEQLVKPVRWIDSMAFLTGQGVDKAVEIGPKTVLKNLMPQNAPSVRTFSFENREDLKTIKRALAADTNSDVPYNGIDLLTRCIAAAVCTKNSNWDNAAYQRGVVEPYQRIYAMREALIKENRQPAPDEMQEAIAWLQEIFKTKGVSSGEENERLQEIFESTNTASLLASLVSAEPEERIPVLQGR